VEPVVTPDEKLTLLDGMTGSAFLAYTRGLVAESERTGKTITGRDQEQVAFAIEVFGADYFYENGE
jgi:hypothetical protein